MIVHLTLLMLILPLAPGVASQTSAMDSSTYPALDTVAPVNDAWSKQYLLGATVPAVAIRTSQTPNPDWSKDVVACPDTNSWAVTYDDGPST
eukprot:jgi/Hompol1/3473/HPOL_006555-RA